MKSFICLSSLLGLAFGAWAAGDPEPAVGNAASVITSVSPAGGRLDTLQIFTIVGTGLRFAKIAVQDCLNDTTYDAPATATLRTVRCRPLTPGVKSVQVAGADSGTTVFFDNPTRWGRPESRGIPAVGGVSLFNGNYFHQVTDLSLPGKSAPFTVTRSYNSYSWPVGSDTPAVQRGSVDECRPWRLNWVLKAGNVPDNGRNQKQIFIEQADGSGLTFALQADGRWAPIDQGNFDRLVVSADNLTVYTRAGLVQVFEVPGGTKDGRLRSVADAHGQTFTLAYAARNVLRTVTDPNGRKFTFTFDGSRPLSVRDDFGRVVNYTWEVDTPLCASAAGSAGTRERLKTVTDIRNEVTTYTYETQGGTSGPVLLTRITDPLLKPVVQLTWGNQVYGNWGVASLANGVGDRWSFRYCADAAATESDPGVCGDTTAAVRFRTTITPPAMNPVLADRLQFFDTAGRPTTSVSSGGQRSVSVPQPRQDPTGALTAANYNKSGLRKEYRTPLGNAGGFATAYKYTDDKSLLEKVTDAENKEHLTGWSQLGADRELFCVASRTTPTGLTSTTGRDARCRVTQQAEPGSPPTVFSYARTDLPTRPDTVTDPRLNTTRMEYDAYGRPTASFGPMNETTRWTYDDIGRLLTQTNPLGGVTRYEYEGTTSLVAKVTDVAANLVTESTYDKAGNVLTRKEPTGQVTSYEYDSANRLAGTSTTVTTRLGAQVVATRTAYDALGRVASTTNANQHASQSSFDASGNVATRANALAQTTRYEYDDDNRVVRVIDPMQRETTTTYDKVGRVKSVTTLAGTQSYDYDADGRVTRHVDARGNATQYGYDPVTGRLTEVIDARLQPTNASYDAAGNVISITDPNRHTTTFEYDKSNRRIKRTDPRGNVWEWVYDGAGNVTRSIAPGLITDYFYDAAGRLLRTVLPGPTEISYGYDAAGNRATMTDSTGITRYAYDGLRRLTQVTDPRGKALVYDYDPAGNRVAIVYPHGKTVGYGFDAAERMVSVSDWLGQTHRYTLNAAGQVTQLALGNGTLATMDYDGASRLKSLVNSGPGGTVISSHQLTMDPEGNIEEAAVQLPLLPSFGTSTKAMTYDTANRLATVDGAPVTHDDAGRLTAIGNEGYFYDARDLLTSITGPNAGTYTYNGAGHRVSRTVASTGATTRYVIDPNAALFNVVAENDGADALLRSYLYGYGLLMQISAADVARYYHFDPTGHTLALTDSAGVVSDRYAYTPYGETTTSGTSTNPFRFVGKFGVIDDGAGLLSMRSRVYSLLVSRFLTLDTDEGQIYSAIQLNRYGYVDLNPVNDIDPSGEAPKRRFTRKVPKHVPIRPLAERIEEQFVPLIEESISVVPNQNADSSNTDRDGQCVTFVKKSRPNDLGKITFGDFGPGRADHIASKGFRVDHIPQAGAAFVLGNGHVGMVDSVTRTEDGQGYIVTVTDANRDGGPDPKNSGMKTAATGHMRTSTLTIDSSGAGRLPGFAKSVTFSFVHEKE